MMLEERRRLIESLIDERGNVTVSDLENRLRVSPMTIWRDLRQLEAAGKLRRVHGGAVKMEISSDDGNAGGGEPLFTVKRDVYSREKAAIAAYATREFVHDGDIVAIEGGTTVASMLPHMCQQGITILTNGLHILNLAAEYLPRITILASGGILREHSLTFVGPQAEQFFARMHADTFFLSATGLTSREGLTDPNPLEIQVKRAMAACSTRCVLLMDASKFGVRSLAQAVPLETIHHLVTDASPPADIRKAIEEHGIDLHIVPRRWDDKTG